MELVKAIKTVMVGIALVTVLVSLTVMARAAEGQQDAATKYFQKILGFEDESLAQDNIEGTAEWIEQTARNTDRVADAARQGTWYLNGYCGNALTPDDGGSVNFPFNGNKKQGDGQGVDIQSPSDKANNATLGVSAQ